MQDIKHLIKEKESPLRRMMTRRRGCSPNLRRRLDESPRRKLRLRFILPVIAAMLGLWPLYSLLANTASLSSGQKADAKPAASAPKLSSLDSFQSLQFSSDLIQSARLVANKMESSLPDGGSVTYNLDPILQQKGLLPTTMIFMPKETSLPVG